MKGRVPGDDASVSPGQSGSAAEAVASHDLREAAIVGVRWMAAVRGLAEAVSFGSLVLLAHLIPPAAYGKAAIALIVPALASILTFEACGSILVQRQTVDDAHLRGATLLALLLGAVSTAATFLVSPLVLDPLLGSATSELVQLSSPAFLMASISAVSLALLLRDLQFRATGLIEISSLLAGVIGSVVLALAGLDAEAIVLGALIKTAVAMGMMVAAAPPPLPAVRAREIREVAAFGVPAALQGVSWIAFRNVDYVIIGARLGAAQMGYYFRAFQFGVEYPGKINAVVIQLAFPIFSRTEDGAHLERLQARVVRMQTVLTFPLLASLVVLAPLLVPWLLGAQWAPAVVPTQILAAAGMAFTPLGTTGQAMLAAGHPRPLFAFNLAALVVYGVAIFLAAPHGLTVVCVVAAGVHVAMLLANYRFLLGPFLGIPLRRLRQHIGPAVGASAALIALELPLAELLPRAGAPVPVAIVLAASAGFAVYAIALRHVFTATWTDCLSMARGVLRRSSGRQPTLATTPAPPPVRA